MDSKLPQTVFEEENRRPKMIKRAVIGLSTVVVISLVVSLSIYFGMKMTRDTYEEAWQTFKTADGKKVEEKISVTEDSVDIKVPNEMEVIYDYKHGLKVQRFIHHDTGRYGPCYATYINGSTDANPQDATGQNLLEKSGLDMELASYLPVDLTGEINIEKKSVKFTEKKVPSSMLSEDVREMCHDTEVYWMEYEDNTMAKRSLSCAYNILYYYCYIYTDYAICYFYDVCYDADGTILGYEEYTKKYTF